MKSIRDRGFIPVVTGGILTAIVVMAVYWPARENGFVWDDWEPLTQSPVFRDPSRWREALLTAPLKDPVATRPVAMLSFMLQLWAGHTEPGPFHVASLLLHAVNVFLVSLLTWRFIRGTATARMAALGGALAGLTYGLHPALTESVLWISCRYDLLMTFFLLFALLLDRTLSAGRWLRPILVSGMFLSAVLSKETAVGFLLALPLLHMALCRLGDQPSAASIWASTWAQNWKVYLALFTVSILYLCARYALFGASIGMDRMAFQFHDVDSPDQRALAVAASLSQHILDALWPFRNVIPSRSLQLPIEFSDILPQVAVGTCILLVVILGLRSGGVVATVALLFLAFLASLAPVSNLLPLPGRLGELWVSSRYLTFPLVIVCLALPLAVGVAQACLARHVSRSRTLLVAIIAAWLTASILNVRVTIPLWKNEETLGLWALRQGATEYWRYQNLGDYHLRMRKFQQAREAFAAAVKLRGDLGLIWNQLGLAEALLGNTAEAHRAFRRAVEVDPNIVSARINIAKLELAAGKPQAAAQVLEQALGRTIDPEEDDDVGMLYYLLGNAYAAIGRSADAVAALEAAQAYAQNPQDRSTAGEALRRLLPSVTPKSDQAK
jgi:tetratricopeptide (TPR) repeat protein